MKCREEREAVPLNLLSEETVPFHAEKNIVGVGQGCSGGEVGVR